MWQFKSVTGLCLAALLLVFCVSTIEAGRNRHRSSHKKRDSSVHIEIYYPKGLMVWYPQRPGVVSFGIDIFLNQKYVPLRDMVCDICLNTTEVSYGKFMLRSDDAIIRGGDHLTYNAIIQKVNGSAYSLKSNDFYVAESRILMRDVGCSSTSNTGARVGNDESDVTKLEDDIALLENIVYDMVQHCNNVTQISKNLYLGVRPADTRLDAEALYKFTLEKLKQLLPKMDWDKTLINAYHYDEGIAFEVKTLVDKLKALQMARNSAPDTVTDLDEMDESNEIGYTEH